MPFSRLLAAALVASAVSLASASAPASAQGTTPPQPTLKSAKDSGTAANPVAGGMTRQQRLSLCLESWDVQTRMSKREWRAACERSVKDYPTAFQ